MKVIQTSDGNWSVIDDNGTILVEGLSNSAAWRWVDRKMGDPVSRSEKVSEWVWEQRTKIIKQEEPRLTARFSKYRGSSSKEE